jgi:hypothetical protein
LRWWTCRVARGKTLTKADAILSGVFTVICPNIGAGLGKSKIRVTIDASFEAVNLKVYSTFDSYCS